MPPLCSWAMVSVYQEQGYHGCHILGPGRSEMQLPILASYVTSRTYCPKICKGTGLTAYGAGGK